MLNIIAHQIHVYPVIWGLKVIILYCIKKLVPVFLIQNFDSLTVKKIEK